MAEVRIGCSGWSYPHWKGAFYPPALPARSWFGWYAGRFDTCELNSSFYRLPKPETVAAWAARAPPGFLFAWKVSRFISHNKKLLDCQAPIELVFGRMRALAEKEGPALIQLSPRLRRDDARLAAFADWLPPDRRCAIEFRHPSWYAAPVLDLLARRRLALCISDHRHAPAPFEATADFVYLRGHGPQGSYAGRYAPETLAGWAGRIESWRTSGRDVYVYFDNDVGGAAPADAAALISLTGRGG